MIYNSKQLKILDIINNNNFVHIDCLESGVGASTLLKETASIYSNCEFKVCYVVDKQIDLKFLRNNQRIFQCVCGSFFEKIRGRAFDVIIFDNCIIDHINFNALFSSLNPDGKIISIYTGGKHPEMTNILEKFILGPTIEIFKRKKIT